MLENKKLFSHDSAIKACKWYLMLGIEKKNIVYWDIV